MPRLALAALALFLTAGAAAACDQPEARARFDRAVAAGVIHDINVYDEQVTVTVDSGVWAGLRLDTRLGMFTTIECALFGPGQVLARAQVIDPRGVQLATWDGRRRAIDARR